MLQCLSNEHFNSIKSFAIQNSYCEAGIQLLVKCVTMHIPKHPINGIVPSTTDVQCLLFWN